jgi:purine-binding chemotaxis protein CheW
MSNVSTLDKFLTFVLADEDYAVPVENVREVLEVGDITKVPGTPQAMRGVINVRGSVVPVMDLRLKFGMSETEHTRDACIIVMELRRGTGDEEAAIIGALADSVQEVLELPEEQLQDAPQFGSAIDSRYIRALARHEEEFIMVLDLPEVFGHQELQMAQDHGSDDADRAQPAGGAPRDQVAGGATDPRKVDSDGPAHGSAQSNGG